MSILYFCPPSPKPNGGTKQIFRHVEALSAAGFDAHVLNLDSRHRVWFDSTAHVAVVKRPALAVWRDSLRRRVIPLEWLHAVEAPMIDIDDLAGGGRIRRQLTPQDTIVIPEFYGTLLRECAFGSQMVIFNQNAHYTFRRATHADDLSGMVYRVPGMRVIAVSKQNVEYLSHAFPALQIVLTINGVDLERFHSGGIKKKQIAFMPRKLPQDLVQVIQILKARGALEGWTLRAIDQLTERQVAELLRESAIFLSSCDAEGFGLPPLEAAASGSIVVGYCGQAAHEFMRPEHCFPIDQGNVLAFARTLEQVITDYNRDPAPLMSRAQAHAAFVRGRYSKVDEARSVVEAWELLLGQQVLDTQRVGVADAAAVAA